MVEVECPVEPDCDYSGSVGSVEAHISGSQSGDHRGEVGRDHRGELVAQAEGRSPEGATTPDEVAESPNGVQTDTTPFEVGSEGDPDPSEGEGSPATSEGGSRPDIPPQTALIAATALFGLWALAEGGVFASGGSASGEQSADQDGEADAPDRSGGGVGLIEG